MLLMIDMLIEAFLSVHDPHQYGGVIDIYSWSVAQHRASRMSMGESWTSPAGL